MYVHVNIFGEVLLKGTFCSAYFSGTSSRELHQAESFVESIILLKKIAMNSKDF